MTAPYCVGALPDSLLIYRDGKCIGVMFTPGDAALVVEALNALPRCREASCPDFGDPDFGEGTCPVWHADGRP